jgi:hypothetical protein
MRKPGLTRILISIAAVLLEINIAAAAGDNAIDQPPYTDRSLLDTFEHIQENAAVFNNRSKGFSFEDEYDVGCPRFTSLIYSAGNKLQFITPTYSLFGLGAYTRDGYQANSTDIIFPNDACRYIITIKKFAFFDGKEMEVPFFPRLTAEDIERLRVLRGVAPATRRAQPDPNSGVEVRNNRIILNMDKIDPDRSGTNEISFFFEPSSQRIDFYGMIYFSTKHFNTNIVNVSEGFRLEFRKNESIRAYEINYINPQARVYFSITKELLLNGVWTEVFPKN